MMPGTHLLLGLCFSFGVLIIFPFIGFFGLIIILLASVLIDVDHYIAYIRAGNGWSARKAYFWYIHPKNTIKDFVEKAFVPFHSIEFLLIILFCIFGFRLISPILSIFFFYILLGCLFHLILDLIFIIYQKLQGHHKEAYIKISFVYTYCKNMLLLKSEHKKNLAFFNQNQKV